MSHPSGGVATGDPVEDAAAAGGRPTDKNDRRTHLGIALTVISAAQLMVILDGTIVNIALPHIKTDLGFSQADLAWVVNAYTLAFGGLLLLGGRLGDILGRRKVFMAGVLIFAIASLFGGLAQTEAQMIAVRVLQGIGAAAASPTALSLITTTFPAGPPRNRAFAVYAAMSGAGAAIGLILGGALTEISWRWTFFINVPIGILVAVLAPIYLGESERQRGRFDLPGAITGTAGLVSLVYGLTHAAPPGSWGDPVTVAFLGAGVALLAVFLVIEARSTHALMPFRVLANRNRATTYIAMLAIGAALFSMFYFLGQYIQVVLGYSAIVTGVAFLPFSFGIVGSAQLGSFLVARIDPRWISGSGALLTALGMFLLSRVSVGSQLLPGPHRADARDLDRDGPGLRAADAHRRRRRPQGGHRRGVRRAQHDAADRRRHRPRHPQHRGGQRPDRVHHRARGADGRTGHAGSVQRLVHPRRHPGDGGECGDRPGGCGADLQPADDQPHRPGQRLGLPARGRHGLEVTD